MSTIDEQWTLTVRQQFHPESRESISTVLFAMAERYYVPTTVLVSVSVCDGVMELLLVISTRQFVLKL